MTEVVADVLPEHRPDRIGVLTGPNLAREVARASRPRRWSRSATPRPADELQTLFMTATFRVYTNPDVVGCEIAGALKNVIALAAGHRRTGSATATTPRPRSSPAGSPSSPGSASRSAATR